MPSMTFRCVSPPNTFPGPSPVSIHLLLTLLLANRVSGWGGAHWQSSPRSSWGEVTGREQVKLLQR